MYLPSLFFGGSSILHLLAGHPRVVALVGLGALMHTLVSPFGWADMPGTPGYVKHLEEVASVSGTVDAAEIGRARQAVQVHMESSPERLRSIVDETLRECGRQCVGTNVTAVLNDPALLRTVLFLHELDEVNARNTTAHGRAVAGQSKAATDRR